MRVFIAVDVGSPVREEARRLRERLRAERHEAERALRWVDPQQMHLTLRFLGEIDEASAQRLVAAFREALALQRFGYRVAAPSWFPTAARPRVLVREVTDGRDDIASIVQEVEVRVRRAGVAAEADSRPLRPHITLARVREGRERALRSVPPAWWAAAVPSEGAPTMIGHLTVVQSQLTPHGPEYRALAETALAGVQ